MRNGGEATSGAWYFGAWRLVQSTASSVWYFGAGCLVQVPSTGAGTKYQVPALVQSTKYRRLGLCRARQEPRSVRGRRIGTAAANTRTAPGRRPAADGRLLGRIYAPGRASGSQSRVQPTSSSAAASDRVPVAPKFPVATAGAAPRPGSVRAAGAGRAAASRVFSRGPALLSPWLLRHGPAALRPRCRRPRKHHDSEPIATASAGPDHRVRRPGSAKKASTGRGGAEPLFALDGAGRAGAVTPYRSGQHGENSWKPQAGRRADCGVLVFRGWIAYAHARPQAIHPAPCWLFLC